MSIFREIYSFLHHLVHHFYGEDFWEANTLEDSEVSSSIEEISSTEDNSPLPSVERERPDLSDDGTIDLVSSDESHDGNILENDNQSETSEAPPLNKKLDSLSGERHMIEPSNDEPQPISPSMEPARTNTSSLATMSSGEPKHCGPSSSTEDDDVVLIKIKRKKHENKCNCNESSKRQKINNHSDEKATLGPNIIRESSDHYEVINLDSEDSD